MGAKFDFCGWATKNNLKCADGRTIMRNAFIDDDGKTVPLVYGHNHDDPSKVLGHAILENTDDGVYAYGFFNETPAGQNAKLLVEHGDLRYMSIYANKLTQQGGNVLHGAIREVSLVLAGANPGAKIEYCPSLAHSDDGYEYDDYDVIIHTDSEIEVYDDDEEYEDDYDDEEYEDDYDDEEYEDDYDDEEFEHADGMTVGDVLDGMDEEKRNAVDFFTKMAHADQTGEDFDYDEDELAHNQEIYKSMNANEKKVCDYLVGMELSDEEEEDESMKHNIFDVEDYDYDAEVLEHDAMDTIIGDAKRFGSMKESFIAHADEYGIENLEYLFPEDHNMNVPPEFIKRDTGWVSKVMNGVHHTPFSRVKTMFADITEDEARAKGYIKGKLKKEEVFSLLKRSVGPTTVYKKQKMDRDDIIDITDFNVLAWLKTEMRMMLDEEIARAILFGDGRLASSDDKIKETSVIPAINDHDLFTIRWSVSGSDESERAKNFIKASIKSRKNYKGSGNPIMITSEDMLTEMLLLEDTTGRKLYKTEAELTTALRVREIVTCPIMDNLKDKDNKSVYALIINLSDYNVGADKGGSIEMFEDFDIDYNQEKYLIETRCSGALTKPFSAIVLRAGATTQSEEPTLAEAKAALAH